MNLKNFSKFLSKNWRPAMQILLVVLFLVAVQSLFAQGLTPQSNPFGTRGDQAIGSFGSIILTILNAAGFYGGIACIFIVGYKLAASQPWIAPALGAVVGLGGWTLIGAVAWQMGNAQAFQIPMIT